MQKYYTLIISIKAKHNVKYILIIMLSKTTIVFTIMPQHWCLFTMSYHVSSKYV